MGRGGYGILKLHGSHSRHQAGSSLHGEKQPDLAVFAPQPLFCPSRALPFIAATKAYVLSFSRALNQELKKRGIRVTAVCPGPVKTEFFHTACKGGLKIPVYKGLFMADPAKVVKKAIKDGEKGKALSIYGPFMKGFYMLTRILPRGLFCPGSTQRMKTDENKKDQREIWISSQEKNKAAFENRPVRPEYCAPFNCRIWDHQNQK